MKKILLILICLPMIGFGQNVPRTSWSNYEISECEGVFKPFALVFLNETALDMDADILGECICDQAEANYASYHEFKKLMDNRTEEIAENLLTPCMPASPDYPDAKCLEGDCVNGYGKFYLAEGNYYEGNFKNGLMHGKGTLVMSGVEGSGKFRNGVQHGKFILKDLSTGIIREVRFKNGVMQ